MELSFDLAFAQKNTSTATPSDFQSVYSSASTTASSSTPSPPLADNIEHTCVSNVAAFSSSGAAQKSNPTLRKPKEGTSVKQRKRKRKKKKSSLPTQIVVGNYSSDFDTALLLNYFEDYCGNVKSYDFGYMLGELNFGFITFTDVKSVEKAAALSNTIVFGETISVTVQNKNKTKTSKVEVSNKLVIKNLPHLPGHESAAIAGTKPYTGSDIVRNAILERTSFMPTDVELYHDKQGRTRGIAFVTFDSVQTSIQAKNSLCASKFFIANRELVVEYFQNNRTSSESNGATPPLTPGAGTVSCTQGDQNNMGTLNKVQQFDSNKSIRRSSSPGSSKNVITRRKSPSASLLNQYPIRQRVYNSATAASRASSVSPVEHTVSQNISMLASEFDDKASVASLGSSIGSERSSRSRMLSFDGLDSIYSNTSSTEIENSSPLQFQSGPHSVQSATDIISHYPKLDTNYNATAALDHAIANKTYSGRHRYVQGSNFCSGERRRTGNSGSSTAFVHSTKNNSSVLRFAQGPDGTKGFKLKRSLT